MASTVGRSVQEFYNKTPFPDYDLSRFNSKEDLRLSAYRFASLLDRSIPTSASVIDVGTGTGQLSALLSLRRTGVWGIDFSDSSLHKAHALKEKLQLNSLTLKKVDLMDPLEVSNLRMTFDYVLCLGVLHHTADAYRGFQNILPLLKQGGYIAVGLYNRFGRIPLQVRKILARTLFKNNNKVKDWFIRIQIGEIEDTERARGWWNDQYIHPHETTHTVGEILQWFKRNEIEYYGAVPSLTLLDQSNLEIKGLWNKTGVAYPYFPIRLYKQLTWIWETHHEGGYWVMLGKKKGLH